ncbi:predicted protein [Sclerotinia sclerotiorum 1980 UF-70]|uniref:Uncharacterized protein n=1 Tax=Sclerotinia sclerotiorum (strain ATCC 18683 / 1980 / Ss-1) TaxID=665079 RepID=A7ENK0_SCLS1|nr:predicted protein [Sclerotinia sclerotiorum 1980 UF-70]EDO04416.1 predicted protein [Sclerotinia sclerotiorum 1980 UF-70]
MPSEENSASGPAGPYHTEYQGDSESLELNESVYDGDISDDLTDNELQDAELSERLHQEVSDYFSRNVMDRQHIFGAFRLYERILIEHRGRSNSRVLRAADFREQVAGFSNVFMRYLIHVRNPAIKLGTRDQAIDNLLIPAPVDETQAELEPCPICNETFEAATGDGKSRTNHEACMLPDSERCNDLGERIQEQRTTILSEILQLNYLIR